MTDPLQGIPPEAIKAARQVLADAVVWRDVAPDMAESLADAVLVAVRPWFRTPRFDMPDPAMDWWVTIQVAQYTNCSQATISSYRRRNQIPAAERMFGRSPAWRPATIIEWHEGKTRQRDGRRRVGET